VSTTSVNIPGGLSYYPVLGTGTTAINDITIASGGSLTVTGATLQVGGDITNYGTFTAINGGVEMNGSSSQAILPGTFSGKTIKDLTIDNNNGVNLNDTLKLSGVLT